jgi:hypothetical protein
MAISPLRRPTALVGMLFLAACSPGEPAIDGRLASVMALAQGDCLNDASADDSIDAIEDYDDGVYQVRKLDCAQPHKYEVYHLHRASEGDYPGAEAMAALASKVCEAKFQGFVGRAYDDSELDFEVLWPSEDGWNTESDREVVCLLTRMDDSPMLGSMRGSKR